MTKREKILFALILLFLTTLFFPLIKLANIFAAIFLGLYAFFFFNWEGSFATLWKQKWQLLKERKYLQWMLLFFLMVVISVLLSSNFHKALRYLDPRLPLLYFPVGIGLLQLRKEFKEKILLSFAWLTSFMVLLCFCWGVYRSVFFKKPEFLYNDSLTEIFDQQSIYISLLVNLSIYIFTYHIIYKRSRYKRWMILAVLFLFAMSYLLASRNLMLVLYAVAIGFAVYYIVKQKKYLEGFTLLIGLLLGVLLIFKFFPKTFNRFKELTYTQFNYQSMGKESHYNMEVTKDQWNGANFRMAAWRCGWELFLSNPIKGVDIGDKHDALMEKYKEKKFQFGLQTKRNVHNNYLDILYSLGIIGLILFLMGWILLPLIYAKKHKDWLTILIILTFASAWITEIYFDRNLGGMLTGFFIPFLLTDKPRNPVV
ncbi:MAG TPA: O-antigen ligase family protein [Chitinophagaceae bacterium]|jgi:O-antigen ligase|nr:O-antigen ligase family protein [Chitinophagaceae bacterium]